MNEPDIGRLEATFQRAAELSLGERSAFLDAECASEPALRRRLDAMLADLDQGRSLSPPAFADDEAELVEGAGTIIGRYKLLQKIGEGGFGVVYMAEQREPVVRRVALKIIKLGMDTREVVARFEAERQALALMDHPNIARVLDGGATDSGRPFFVMELVRGVSVTEYCDENSLSTKERLALFISICRAAEHAHQKGVIHRDIKPSNVMVTLHDGQPVVKVIDFGVAKAMHARLTEKTLFTAFGRFIGTPAYMSPEQAELSGLDVDTRTDIYSLGVLLYELLTATTPFDLHAMLEEGLAGIQRTIREQPPEKPSLRISTTADATIARQRATDVSALTRTLKGDLDWIVMKCLEKERVRRYGTVNELAADIERHLRSDPVLAGPPSSAYRTRKFLARNRTAVVSIGVVVCGLVVGIVGLGLGLMKAREGRDEAIRLKGTAEEEAARTREVTEFLIDTLALTDPEVAMTADLSVATLLDRSSQRIAAVFQDQPQAEARLRVTIGRGYKALGQNEQALFQLRRGVEGLRSFPEPDLAEVYFAMWELTHVLFALEEPDAMEVAQEARRVAHDHIRLSQPELADTLDRFIAAINDASFSMDLTAGERLPAAFEESVRVSDATLSPGDALWPLVADAWVSAGYSIWYGPYDAFSVDLFARALEILEREFPPAHPYIGEITSLYVDALTRNGRAADAESVIRDRVAEMQRILPPTSPELALAESLLGQNLAAMGRFEEAEALLVRGHGVIAKSIGDDVNNFTLADSCGRVLRMYDAWGQAEKAEPYRRELRSIAANSEFVQPWPLIRLALGDENAKLVALIDPLQAKLGSLSYTARVQSIDVTEVEAEMSELLDLADAEFEDGDELQTVLARYLLIWGSSLDGFGPLRRRMVERGLRVLSRFGDTYAIELADGNAQLSDALAAEGDIDGAKRHARLASSLLEDRTGPWTLANVRVRVARTLTDRGLYAESERHLLEGYATLSEHFGEQNPDAVLARELLIETYEDWGKPEQARRWRFRLDQAR